MSFASESYKTLYTLYTPRIIRRQFLPAHVHGQYCSHAEVRLRGSPVTNCMAAQRERAIADGEVQCGAGRDYER